MTINEDYVIKNQEGVRMKNIASRLLHFLRAGIWRIHLKHLSRTKSFFIKQLRIVLLTFRGFREDKCQLRSSALTFLTLLAIVPALALAFGIAKGFGFEIFLEEQILERLSGQEEVLLRVVSFAKKLLQEAKGGVVAGVGMAIIFWTVIKALWNIEESFNAIWGIKKPRTLGRKFTDYFCVMLVCPLLFIVSGSATVFIATKIGFLFSKFAFLEVLGGPVFFVLRFLPYGMSWILFSFLYIFMPNTKVNSSSGILAGIIAGTAYEVLQWAYIAFQIGVTRSNAIYGSFAALPLFLIWLRISWIIVFLGAEISFASQNVDTYEFEPDCLKVSNSFKKLLSLRTAHLLVKNFSKNAKPLTAKQIAERLEMPVRLVNQVLYELVESGILSETKGRGYKEVTYQPGRDICNLKIEDVLRALERRGTDSIPVEGTPQLKSFSESLETFSQLIRESSQNKLLRDI